MNRAIPSLLALLSAVVLLTSCSSLSVNNLPQPGKSYSDGYDIVMEFANVLNLPDRAKVVIDGTAVGVVTKVASARDHVDVTARIEPSVTVPSNAHATLQQATVLGDIYVALERSQQDSATTALSAGGRIPLSNTTSPPQLEDTIANMANFVASGSIQRVQQAIIGINRVTPPEPDVRKLTTRVAVDLSDLASNMDLVDQWLDGVSRTGDVMAVHVPDFQHWFSPAGMLGFDRGTTTASYVGLLLPSIGSIYNGGFWLVPLLDSLGVTMGAIQHSKWAVEDEVPHWRKLFTDFFLPVDKNPAINITSIQGPDGRELSGNIQDVLRILGATP